MIAVSAWRRVWSPCRGWPLVVGPWEVVPGAWLPVRGAQVREPGSGSGFHGAVHAPAATPVVEACREGVIMMARGSQRPNRSSRDAHTDALVRSLVTLRPVGSCRLRRVPDHPAPMSPLGFAAFSRVPLRQRRLSRSGSNIKFASFAASRAVGALRNGSPAGPSADPYRSMCRLDAARRPLWLWRPSQRR